MEENIGQNSEHIQIIFENKIFRVKTYRCRNPAIKEDIKKTQIFTSIIKKNCKKHVNLLLVRISRVS